MLGAFLMAGDMAVKKTDKILVLMEKTGDSKQRNKNFIQD